MASRRSFVQTIALAVGASTLIGRNLLAQLLGSKYKFEMDGGPGPETAINGKRFLYFGGTGYFSLQTHPELIQAAQKATADFGIGTATSRNVFGTSPLYLEVERSAGKFFGTEDAIYLPSGYLINIAGLQSLVALRRFDSMFVDEGAHWSITDFMYALQKPVHMFAHGDPEDLRDQLKQNLRPGEKPLVLSDGIFPAFGKIAPIPEYFKAIEPYNGCMWLDDCHAIGVIGNNGRGTYEHYGLQSDRLYFGGTLSKAVGAHGGIIPGAQKFILPIRTGHIANGANASPAAAAGAAVKGMQLLMSKPELRQQLWKNARQLKSGLQAMGFDQDKSGIPIAAWTLKTSEDMDRVHTELMNRGIAIQRTHYVGTGANGALRAVVFANHRPDQISRMLDELKKLV
ncbi:MAG: pyridoxal phosphate-dependent aminotransferase family protein [Terriglobales bacterium]